MKTKILILTIAAALPATLTHAQNDGAPRDGARKEGPRDGERAKGQDGPRDRQRPPGPLAPPFVRALDADDDGIISADEIKGAPAALKKLDKNADGQLSRDEWGPSPSGPRGGAERDGQPRPGPRDGESAPGGPRDGEGAKGGPRDGEGRAAGGNRDPQKRGEQGPRPPVPPLVEALDADHGGTISAEEIDKSSAALAKLDQNKDGQLGPREYGARPPQGPPPRDGEKPAQ